MIKAKTIDISDSNMALFGSDVEKNIKLAAAQTEKAWQGAGKEVGIQIWRIEKFQVVHWPKEEYGKFFDGDSYIVLHTYKKKDTPKLFFDLYFWLGENTSQDEAGTAAYKTVELDDFLKQEPVQHREVMNHESTGFNALFDKIEILSGGVDSGFRHVTPTEYKARLLQCKGGRRVRVTQVPLSHESLNAGDAFILDNGLTLYQWNGSKASPLEKNKAATLCRAIDDERAGKAEVVVLEEGDTTSGNDTKEVTDFKNLLGGWGDIKTKDEGGDDKSHADSTKPSVWEISDKTGKLQMTDATPKTGKIKKSIFNTKEVFLLDVVNEIIVWVGRLSSKGEKKAAMSYAMKYLEKAGRPAHTPISRILEGGENEIFTSYVV